jgi:hypothetical protein
MRPNLNLSRRALGLALLAGASCALAAGCNGARAYTPDSTSARRALDAALTAWKEGAKPDRLATATPPVHALDFQWQAGRPLDDFSVTGEENADGAAKRFAVTLRLKSTRAKKGADEVHARYVVVGREPVWVYREEDYARLLNMDNNPKPPPQPRRR